MKYRRKIIAKFLLHDIIGIYCLQLSKAFIDSKTLDVKKISVGGNLFMKLFKQRLLTCLADIFFLEYLICLQTFNDNIGMV
jgi:hypothetical protein